MTQMAAKLAQVEADAQLKECLLQSLALMVCSHHQALVSASPVKQVLSATMLELPNLAMSQIHVKVMFVRSATTINTKHHVQLVTTVQQAKMRLFHVQREPTETQLVELLRQIALQLHRDNMPMRLAQLQLLLLKISVYQVSCVQILLLGQLE